MGPTFTLITAILMTLAAITWAVSAVVLSNAGAGSIERWVVAGLFLVLAAVYWRLYFGRKNNSKPSGTE